jgi:hypothetical protein
MRFLRLLLGLRALLDCFVAMISSSFEFFVPGLGLVAVIPWLRARIAIPKPRRNGDETAHALAHECGVGQPIESSLSGRPNFAIDDCAAEIFPLRALKCHLPITSRHLPACFLRVPHCCSPTAGDGVVRF